MTAPNLRNPSSVTGETTPVILTNTLSAILTNAASSNKLYKVNVIRAANISASSATIFVSLRRGATDFYIAHTMLSEPGTSLVVLDRNEFIYLEEGDAIYARANLAVVHLMLHWEEIAL